MFASQYEYVYNDNWEVYEVPRRTLKNIIIPASVENI
jgi:hypothetical protein